MKIVTALVFLPFTVVGLLFGMCRIAFMIGMTYSEKIADWIVE